jgi:lysophospholipase L1-like esterase
LIIFLATAYLSIEIIQANYKGTSSIIGKFIFSIRQAFSSSSSSLDESQLIQELEKYASGEIEEICKGEGREKEYCGGEKNSEGFKDYEHSIEKPNNTFRIIALGDSMTEGPCMKINNTWPKQLEAKLNKLNLSVKFEVFNFGICGAGTLEEVRVFEEFGLKYSPDMVILQFWENDWEDTLWMKNRFTELWEEYQQGKFKLPQKVERRYKELNLSTSDIARLISFIAANEFWSKAKEKGFLEVWKENVEKPLLHLISLCENKNISLIVVTWDIGRDDELKSLERIFNNTIPLINLSPYLQFNSQIRLPDGHLSEEGYDIVSDKILDVINSYLINVSDKR